MKSDDSLQDGGIVSNWAHNIEEYKILVEGMRFTISSYIQTFTIFLALLGFGMKELLVVAPNRLIVLGIGAVLLSLCVLAVIVFHKFKEMADSNLERRTALAKNLDIRAPKSLKWVFSWMMVIIGIITLLSIYITGYKYSNL